PDLVSGSGGGGGTDVGDVTDVLVTAEKINRRESVRPNQTWEPIRVIRMGTSSKERAFLLATALSAIEQHSPRLNSAIDIIAAHCRLHGL
ncbi:MAG: hypothetical protein ACOC23_04865, partial [Thermodesulfobacteriota bacterium]